jgi:sulfite exporter TauE/SafE
VTACLLGRHARVDADEDKVKPRPQVVSRRHYGVRSDPWYALVAMLNVVRWLAIAVLGASLLAFGYSVRDLQDGLLEAGSHWWSTLPALIAIAASLVWAAVGLSERRTNSF